MGAANFPAETALRWSQCCDHPVPDRNCSRHFFPMQGHWERTPFAGRPWAVDRLSVADPEPVRHSTHRAAPSHLAAVSSARERTNAAEDFQIAVGRVRHAFAPSSCDWYRLDLSPAGRQQASAKRSVAPLRVGSSPSPAHDCCRFEFVDLAGTVWPCIAESRLRSSLCVRARKRLRSDLVCRTTYQGSASPPCVPDRRPALRAASSRPACLPRAASVSSQCR